MISVPKTLSSQLTSVTSLGATQIRKQAANSSFMQIKLSLGMLMKGIYSSVDVWYTSITYIKVISMISISRRREE